ncbi:zinc metallochaperone AztD [Kineococcus endophyticus]|uniref:Zinc metallochaperone AztD n=1 Tax=Kineococcus endophyticus TaxID=1181883 RepID=A0ABV3P979_9ACTN
MRRSPLLSLTALPLSLTLLTACGGGVSETPAAPPSTSAAPEATEVGAAKARVAVTYDGGVQVLDASTFEVLADVPYDGFTRLNPAGDGRHVMVSAAGGFHVLDAGAWSEPHGDHSHYYTAKPHETDVVYAAEKPGHVVRHAGRTTLFDDGTGEVVSFDSEHVAHDAVEEGEAREYRTPSAHHGVAVERSDGSLVVTEGTEEARTGIRVLDAQDQQIAANDQCPNTHGETVAADETVVIGCSDGVLVVKGTEITKVQSPDAYGRIGNQWGTDESPVVLGDYKSNPDAEVDLTTRVSLIDTTNATLRLVELPGGTSYWYRSLGRGENGEGVVLGTDGQLHLIDPVAGTVTRSTPVVAPWEVQEDWQAPQPQVFTMDGTAFITEPATKEIHAVDIETGEVYASGTLEVTPNELTAVPGEVTE